MSKFELSADSLGFSGKDLGPRLWKSAFAEGIVVLVFTFFATAMDPRRSLGNAAPIAIGFAILMDNLVGVPLTGASMNPARSFGPAIVAGEWLDNWYDWLAIYVAGPAIGASLAGVVYVLVFWDREEDA